MAALADGTRRQQSCADDQGSGREQLAGSVAGWQVGRLPAQHRRYPNRVENAG